MEAELDDELRHSPADLRKLANKYDHLAADTRKTIKARVEASVISSCLNMVAGAMVEAPVPPPVILSN